MKFTLAIPVYDDYDSLVCCTIANTEMHREYIKRVVIVDNNPRSRQGEATKESCSKMGWDYFPLTEKTGTAPAKDHAIRQCEGMTVCLDSHVILMKGFGEAFTKAVESQGRNALFHGPMVYDDMKRVSTSLDGTWSGGMYGKWTTDNEYYEGADWWPIRNNATGMFATNADTWLGFNPLFKGFGGEEGYLQKKYAKAGRYIFCVRGMRWWHRFGNPNGKKYPLSDFDKFRNYWIGWGELGLPQQEVTDYFLGAKLITPEQAYSIDKVVASCNSCGNSQRKMPGIKFDTLAMAIRTQKVLDSDITEHADTLAMYSKGCRVALDVGSRLLSTYAIAAEATVTVHLGDLPDAYISEANETVLEKEHSVLNGRNIKFETIPVDNIDMVFIDTDPHTLENVSQQLETYGKLSNHYIALHDTTTFPQVMEAVRLFLRANQKWTLVKKLDNNNGLVVLSCAAEDKKVVPGLARKALKLFKSLATFATSGFAMADDTTYEARLDECAVCEFRNDHTCGQCGCPVDRKAALQSEKCPVGRW